jgi:ribosomal-protein-alanine N-acetyltransferase
MQPEDIPQVTEVDREAFPTQWPPIPFKKELNNKLARLLVAYEQRELSPGEGRNCLCQEEREVSSTPGVAYKRGFHGLMSRIRHLLTAERAVEETSPAQAKQYIVGYASLWLMFDEAHLTSIAVRESCRRQGIGELLLLSVINLAVQLNARVATLEVRVSNRSAQALYEKYGFVKVGVRRRYYTDNGEDAYIMTTEQLTSASYQARFQQLKESYFLRWGMTRCPYP